MYITPYILSTFLLKMRLEQSEMCMELKLHYSPSHVHNNYFSDHVYKS